CPPRSVAAGTCNQFHHGRVHSRPVGNCRCHGAGQLHFRTPALVLNGGSSTKENNQENMNMKNLAIVLIVLGLVVLAYSGITFTTPGKSIEFLGMHFETTVSHFISPVAGAVSLLAGVVLLVANPRRT